MSDQTSKCMFIVAVIMFRVKVKNYLLKKYWKVKYIFNKVYIMVIKINI